MGKSKRSSRPKPPSGEEKKNQLDLFLDWANKTAAATVAATAAAKEAATKTLEELWATFDKRLLSICGFQCALLAACAYRGSSILTVIVAVTTAPTALLLVLPWVTGGMPSYANRAVRGGNLLATVLLSVSMVSAAAEIAWTLLSPPSSTQQTPKVEPSPVSPRPDEKSLIEEAQKEAAAEAEKEAARIADCLSKEKSVAAARRKHSGREKDFAKCRTEYETAFTLRSLDAYCSVQRRQLDDAARVLNVAAANLCSTTGSTSKSR